MVTDDYDVSNFQIIVAMNFYNVDLLIIIGMQLRSCFALVYFSNDMFKYQEYKLLRSQNVFIMSGLLTVQWLGRFWLFKGICPLLISWTRSASSITSFVTCSADAAAKLGKWQKKQNTCK